MTSKRLTLNRLPRRRSERLEVAGVGVVAGAEHHDVHVLGQRLVLGVVEVAQDHLQVVAAAVAR